MKWESGSIGVPSYQRRMLYSTKNEMGGGSDRIVPVGRIPKSGWVDKFMDLVPDNYLQPSEPRGKNTRYCLTRPSVGILSGCGIPFPLLAAMGLSSCACSFPLKTCCSSECVRVMQYQAANMIRECPSCNGSMGMKEKGNGRM